MAACFHRSAGEIIFSLNHFQGRKLLHHIFILVGNEPSVVVQANEDWLKHEVMIRGLANAARYLKSAVDVIDVCTNIKDIRSHLQFAVNQGSEEEADMCKALEDIKKEAENRGIKQGVKQGVKQGIDRANKLIQLLLADGRQEDLARSAVDALYQQKLFHEYHI